MVRRNVRSVLVRCAMSTSQNERKKRKIIVYNSADCFVYIFLIKRFRIRDDGPEGSFYCAHEMAVRENF